MPSTPEAETTETAAVATVAAFVAAVNRGDLEGALAHYAEDAVFVAEPGRVLSGREAIRAALGAMLAARPRLLTRAHGVVASADLALYYADWRLEGISPDGNRYVQGGRSADVLRREADGHWRIAVDNPWGADLLDAGRAVAVGE